MVSLGGGILEVKFWRPRRIYANFSGGSKAVKVDNHGRCQPVEMVCGMSVISTPSLPCLVADVV